MPPPRRRTSSRPAKPRSASKTSTAKPRSASKASTPKPRAAAKPRSASKASTPKPRAAAKPRSAPKASTPKPRAAAKPLSGSRTRATTARSLVTGREEAPFSAALAAPPLRASPAMKLVPLPEGGPPSPHLPASMLKRGNRGASVTLLQQALISLGQLDGPTNGAFGSATEEALCHFQQDMGLSLDGSYGPPSREALQQALVTARLPVPLKPPTVSRPSPNHDSRGGVPIDALILHLHPISNQHSPRSAGSSSSSAHYLVAANGTLYQLAPDGRQTWHAGLSALHGQSRPSVNARSIGIELAQPSEGFTSFNEAQYRTLERLVAYLIRRYAIPPGNVLSYREVALGRRPPAADHFDWDRLRRAVSAAA